MLWRIFKLHLSHILSCPCPINASRWGITLGLAPVGSLWLKNVRSSLAREENPFLFPFKCGKLTSSSRSLRGFLIIFSVGTQWISPYFYNSMIQVCTIIFLPLYMPCI